MASSTPQASQLDQITLPDLSSISIANSSSLWSRFQHRWTADYHFRVGYFALAINLFLLLGMILLTSSFEGRGELGYIVVPIISYLLTQVYGIMLAQTKRRTVRLGILYFANLYVGCFILNMSITVFADPTIWWGLACAGAVGVLALEPIKDLLGPKSRIAFLAAAGAAIVVLLHQSCFMLFSDEIMIAGIGLLVGGFGIYAFVPPLVLFSLLVHLGPTLVERQRHFASFSIGVTVPALALFIFCAAFLDRVQTIQNIPSSTYKLPQTVQILEHVQADWLSQLVFTRTSLYQSVPFRTTFSRNTRAQKHSPFMYWANKLSSPLSQSRRDYDKFAQFFAQTGHDVEEALWSSSGLSTASIDIQHKVNQATASVRSTYRFEATSKHARQGEAIYTFQLPEGAVVTGSSLVVFGVEQPGRLSTKSKAREAYTRIVGRERRDPSLVEWRNGNTVAMRVFPVTSKLPRSFSIEVTAPLQKDGDRTFIAPIGIEGPPTSRARITNATAANRTVEAAVGFKETRSDSRGYRPEPIYLTSQAIATQRYVRDGMAYTLESARSNFTDRTIKRIYIDLTEGWTTIEAKQVLAKAKGMAGGAKVFGYNGTSIELTKENLVEVLSSAHKRKRSYFPIYAIKDLESSLLITRDQHLSFKYDAVKKSAWSGKIDSWLANSSTEVSLAHYHLGEDVPSYLQTIGSSRAISSETGDFETLIQRLDEQRFRIFADGPGIIEAFDGHARITALPTEDPNSAGDPALLQLFMYRQSLLTNLLQEPDSIAQEKAFVSARQANAVTPFSSLIVLENDEDYDRFDIPNVIGPNRLAPPKGGTPPAVAVINGEARPAQDLDFVFEQGSGSVPEPHEWALILLSLAILGGMYIRRS
ncbi:MAG: XrtN system VIT domain-containing protein [Saprospiraceae bacterium]